ncbi:MAG TPA: hypothetical protein VI819_02070 [Patescibacteria group bacterium]|nr:hypothetical protein [Patescibacteria group bacterium]
MSKENIENAFDQLFNADPKIAYNYLDRINLAILKTRHALDNGYPGCVTSTVAFTHLGVADNFNYNSTFRIIDIVNMSLEVSKLSKEKLNQTSFHVYDPISSEKIKSALGKFHSAWITNSKIKSSDCGHMIGLIPGRFSGELIIWDTMMKFLCNQTYNYESLILGIESVIDEKDNFGTILTFK